MSSIDLWMRDVLASYGVIVSIILCILIWMIQKWPTLRKDTYRAHLLGFEMECAELASPYKEHLFKALQYIVSNDEMLRSMGSIRILEIGVKTGENVQFYPDGTHLIGVDWNIKLGEYLVKGNRSWQFSHVIIERLITGDGSSLKEVLTGCVDAVVTTRSLCSVKSLQSTLQEIRRVLAPTICMTIFYKLPSNVPIQPVTRRMLKVTWDSTILPSALQISTQDEMRGWKIYFRGTRSREGRHFHTMVTNSIDANRHMACFIW